MGKARVLLVDEDPVARLTVDRQLETLGCDVVSVNSGQEAIRVVELGLQVDVVLADIRLPDLDGRAVAWAISRLCPATRLAFMGSAPPGAPLEPRHAPFLLKPFSTQALEDALAGAATWKQASGC